jgi:cell division ATPase FtsA
MEYNIHMSFFSFLKRNKESYSLVFNISSGSISGGVINFTEKSGVDLISFQKEIIPFQQEISIAKHLELMKSTLTALAGKIKKVGTKKIDRIFYIFTSPWSISQTKTIRIKETKPFRVTESYLNRIVEDQEKKFQADNLTTGRIIEKKIIQVKINGYVVNNFYGKITKDLEISIFFTLVPEKILDTVEEAVTKTFNVKNVWCHSLSLSAISIIKNLFPQKEDFIHIDVGEEITDISIVKDNILASSASIPFGRNNFIRELSKLLKVSEEIADSMIRMHCQKNNDELAALRLSVTMDGAAKEWLGKIFAVLDSFKEKIYVPEAIFLIANNDVTSILKEKLQKQDYKAILLDYNKIKSPVVVEDITFKLELMFLDNLYKL